MDNTILVWDSIYEYPYFEESPACCSRILREYAEGGAQALKRYMFKNGSSPELLLGGDQQAVYILCAGPAPLPGLSRMWYVMKTVRGEDTTYYFRLEPGSVLQRLARDLEAVA